MSGLVAGGGCAGEIHNVQTEHGKQLRVSRADGRVSGWLLGRGTISEGVQINTSIP